jgi:hypothetical protein
VEHSSSHHSTRRPDAHATHADPHEGHHYRRLLLMAGLSFAAMYGLMYAMVDAWANIDASQRAEIAQMRAMLAR